MKLNPHAYAKTLTRTQGGLTALRIARDSYLNTRDLELPEYADHKDPRVKKLRQRKHRTTGVFWDNVFGILLKQEHPNVTRVQYLQGELAQEMNGAMKKFLAKFLGVQL